MTPAERNLLDAAREVSRLHSLRPDVGRHGWLAPLLNAVADLAAAEAAQQEAGRPYTWAEVVTTDLVWSQARGRWFEVLETAAGDGKIQVRFKGIGAMFVKAPGETVQVRRSDMGAAVDIIAQVMRSGPNGERADHE